MKEFLNFNTVTQLNDREFIDVIDNLFINIETIKISYEDVENIWNNLYKDMFDRNYLNDSDIVELNVKYTKLINKYKDGLKAFPMKKHEKEVITIKNNEITNNSYYDNFQDFIFKFDNLNDLEYFIIKNFKNKECNLNKLNFKIGKSTAYKEYSSSLLKDEGRGILTFKKIFYSEFSGKNDFQDPYIELIIKTRYIKTKDIIILKDLEKRIKFIK